MLTDVLVKIFDGIGVTPSYQVRNPGAMKARGTLPDTTAGVGRDRPIL
jgi:hypothetical protein